MKYKTILPIFFVCVFSIFAFGQVQNIKLVPGEKKVLRSSVPNGEEIERLYIFEAKPGQQLTVNISSTGKNAVFSVNEQYRVDRSPIEIDGEPIQDKTGEWSGTLPQSESNGLYSVSVTSSRGTATFTLEITLGNPASETSSDSAISSDTPQKIKDYYLLMPQKYDGSTRAEREEILGYTGETTIDEKNGYISYNTPLSGEVFEIALFKSNGEVFIAYNEDCDLENNVLTKMYFFRYDGGKWIDVTAQTMPGPINKRYKYKLPQIGTTIKVSTADGKKMYDLIWKNGKFEKR